MGSMTLSRLPSRASYTLGLGLVIALLAHVHHYRVNCSSVGHDLWDKYRPVAIDESRSTHAWLNKKSSPELGHYVLGRLPGSLIDEVRVPDNMKVPEDGGKYMKVEKEGETLNDVDQWQGGRVDNSVFRVPSGESSALTKLITGDQTPTFIDETVHVPEISSTGKGGKDRILAKYKFVIPIFVPAFRIKKKGTTVKPAPIQFVKEQVTEMLPVERMETRVKEVIKAERQPMQVITDFVEEVNGKTVPDKVDDKVKANERIISTSVQNID